MQERFLKALPVLLFAIGGIGVGIWIEGIHRQLSADVTYTSFCNVNSRVNCDAVLTSSYAYLGGVTVSLWAIGFYLSVVAAALGAVFFAAPKQRASSANAVFGLSILGILFSLYMAVVAFFVLKTVCLMCTMLYLISLGLFASAWRLRHVPTSGRGRGTAQSQQESNRKVLAGCALAGLLLVLFGAWEALGGRGEALDAEGIRREKPDVYAWFENRPVVDVPAGGHARGPEDAAVTLVEFSDFDCPHCARLDETISGLLRAQRPDVRVIFKHFPLNSECNPAAQGTRHPAACLAAIAAECAGEQDRFWQYQHSLFAQQGRFQRAELVSYARRLELDVGAFERCLDSDAARQRVESDAREGARLGVQSTPTIFINGRRVEGAPKADVLLDALTLARERNARAVP